MSPTGGVLTASPPPGGTPPRVPPGPAEAAPAALSHATGAAATTTTRTPGTASDGWYHTVGTAVHALLPAAARADGEPPITVPRDPAQDAARRELSKRLYHENDPGLFQRALDTLWKWIGDLFDATSAATPGGTLGVVVVVLAVAAVLGALWWRLGTPGRRPASAPALFDDRPRSAAEHRAAAEAHAAQGHWNQAVQERMRAIVRSLEERALLDTRPGRTADEAAADAGRALPAHAERLRTAAHDFDDVTYGGRPSTEPAYRRIAELDLDLERTKPRLTATSAHHPRQGAAG